MIVEDMSVPLVFSFACVQDGTCILTDFSSFWFVMRRVSRVCALVRQVILSVRSLVGAERKSVRAFCEYAQCVIDTKLREQTL